MPIRYGDVDCQEPKMELVSANLYYQEPDCEWIESQENFVDMIGQPYGNFPTKTNSMMSVGPMPTRYPPRRSTPTTPRVKYYYECQGDRYVKECPNRPP